MPFSCPVHENHGRDDLLHELPSALVGLTSLDEILWLTARHVMDALEYEDCVIYLRTAGGDLEQRAAWGPKSPDGVEIVNPLRLAVGEGVVGHAALTREVQLVHDTGADDRYVPDVGSGGSELAVPIVFAGESLGVIDSEHGERNFYTEADASTVSAIAAIVAGMISSALRAEELRETIDQLNKAQRELEHAALTDHLTGVGNRRRLEADLHEAVDSGERFGVAVINLDGLTRINDHYGNLEGDRVLCAVADLLAQRCGEAGLTITRCESDEFVVVAAPSPIQFAVLVASAIDDLRTLRVAGIEAGFELSASAGVAYGTDYATWNDASDALTLAKRDGGGAIWIFREDDPGILRLRSDRRWAQHIEQAVLDDSLCLVAQAIDETVSGRTVWHEVLLRTQEADGSLGSPGALLAAAERLGLEEVIDAWVTRKVVEALAAGPELRLAMNWTVASITSPRMVRLVLDLLHDAGIDPSRLLIEVTEHACIESPEAFDHAVESLRRAGIQVALDDLGSGWSSLRTLQATPVDYIKLDGQWVCGARNDELSRIALRSMVECAAALETSVIAEWVEDDATKQLVADLGIELVQGWLIHRPEPLEDLLTLQRT